LNAASNCFDRHDPDFEEIRGKILFSLISEVPIPQLPPFNDEHFIECGKYVFFFFFFLHLFIFFFSGTYWDRELI
jgi:hypothetical protein